MALSSTEVRRRTRIAAAANTTPLVTRFKETGRRSRVIASLDGLVAPSVAALIAEERLSE